MMNEPKYQIGDRIPGTPVFIRGIATLSNGKSRYFLQAANNTFVLEELEIESVKIYARIYPLIADETIN